MSEPNEPATPLSRMRFSWQRGARTGREQTTLPEPSALPDDPETLASPEPLDSPGPHEPPEPLASVEPSAGVVPPAEPATRPAPSVEPTDPVRLGRAAASVPTAPDVASRAQEPFPARASRLSRPEPTGQPGVEYAATPQALTAPPPAPYTQPYAPPPELPEQPQQPEPPRLRQPQPDRTDRASSGKQRTSQKNQKKREKQEKRSRTAAATFDVPAPGGRFSGGRGSHAAIRVALVLTTCLVVLGVVGISAYSLGVRTTRGSTYHLDPSDVQRYGLTEFPREQAGRFAADYARLCMTHTKDAYADEQRTAQLAKYVTQGVDATCGWAGNGVQAVVDSSWTGAAEPLDDPSFHGHAEVMTVRVLTSTGSRVLAVPVYVTDLRTGQGMRIVGDVGEMPQPILAAPPAAQPVGSVDQKLSDALIRGQFFLQYFQAWGRSDRPSLGRFTTPDATAGATAGLSGTLTTPSIEKAQVFLPRSAGDGSDFTWNKGDRAEAWVWVTWKNPAVGADVSTTRAYRLQLVMTTDGADPAQSWAVRDVRGGVPNAQPQ